VRQGLFGLGSLENDQPVCRYFKEDPFVGLAGSEVIIRADVCQAQREAEAAQTTFQSSEGLGGAVQEPGLATVGGPAGGTDVEAGRRVPILHKRRFRLRFTVPKGKVAGLMGVMNLLQHKFNRLEVVLAVDEGEISEQEYEDKIQEAFRQLGIEVEEE